MSCWVSNADPSQSLRLKPNNPDLAAPKTAHFLSGRALWVRPTHLTSWWFCQSFSSYIRSILNAPLKNTSVLYNETSEERLSGDSGSGKLECYELIMKRDLPLEWYPLFCSDYRASNRYSVHFWSRCSRLRSRPLDRAVRRLKEDKRLLKFDRIYRANSTVHCKFLWMRRKPLSAARRKRGERKRLVEVFVKLYYFFRVLFTETRRSAIRVRMRPRQSWCWTLHQGRKDN